MSTEHQKYSTENQAQIIEAYALRRGLEVVRTYADAGKSGLRLDGRDSLRQLLADVQSGAAGFTDILVYDVRRWGRFQDADQSAYYDNVCRRAPPFEYLQMAASVTALFTTLVILATQSREDKAARHRSQLTLQLASLSEQKIAKVIQLLEEQRLDNPQLSERADPEAEEMAKAVDPGLVLDRIKWM